MLIKYTRSTTAKWYPQRCHWRIDVQRDGERKTFYDATPGRAGMLKCNAKADEWLSKKQRGVITDDLLLDDLLEKWLEREKATTSTSSYKQYESFARNHIAPRCQGLPTSRLSDGLLQDVLDAAAMKGLSQKTVAGIRGALISFCKWCRRNKYTDFIPSDLAIPRTAQKGQKNIMSKENIQRLLNDDFDDLYINFYRLAVLTGMRPGELLGLEWDNVNDDFIMVRYSINVHGEETRGKNDNARRDIAQNDLTRDVFAKQRAMLKRRGVISPHVFCDEAGAVPNERLVYRCFKSFCAANNIDDLTLYELRHTFISMNKSMPTGLLKATVGHSASMRTYETYSHEVDGDKRQAAEYSAEIYHKIMQR